MLTDEQRNEEGYVSHEARVDLIGKCGVAITVLRPAGTALIDDERVDVVTEGEYIERHRPIEVVDVDGLKVVVRECKKRRKSYDTGSTFIYYCACVRACVASCIFSFVPVMLWISALASGVPISILPSLGCGCVASFHRVSLIR